MRSMIAATSFMLVLASCTMVGPDENARDYGSETVAGDYSQIADPRDRWEAYDLENYTVEQTRTCECLPPYTYTVVVKQGEVVDVRYDLPGGEEARPVNDYETVLASAMTVDALFALIEREKPSAADVKVEYHPRYGYPTEVYVDRVERMADDEIIRSLENLKELVD